MVAGIVGSASANGGKRAFGEVKSFDGVVLTMSMGNGGTLVAPVADDVQIKIVHRSNKGHAKHSKSPSAGTVADLVPGAKIYRIKVMCEEVVKLRISRAPAASAAAAVVTVRSAGSDDTSDDADEADQETPDNPCDDDEAADDDAEVGVPGSGGDEVDTPDDGSTDDEPADDPADDDGGLVPGLPL
jgi:hypothetical protein